jgi:hypothetical protein
LEVDVSQGKNAMYGNIEEATFGFLKVRLTTYPNASYMVQLGPKGGDIDDPRGTIAVNGKVYELISELRHIADWLENQP